LFRFWFQKTNKTNRQTFFEKKVVKKAPLPAKVLHDILWSDSIEVNPLCSNKKKKKKTKDKKKKKKNF